MEAIDD